jgi:hypothetical protein
MGDARRSAGEIYEGGIVRSQNVNTSDGFCTVSVRSSSSNGFNCRILVRCAGRTVYGANDSGYNRCQRRGGTFVGANDTGQTRTDGDPAMSFDLSRRSVQVRDRGLELVLTLDPPPTQPNPSGGVAPVPVNPF